jgi:Carboxypeptidase regulatory-like domain
MEPIIYLSRREIFTGLSAPRNQGKTGRKRRRSMTTYVKRIPRVLVGLAAVALLLAPGIGLGQAQTGNLFARAVDEQRAPLPGVSVTLSGMGAPVTQFSNAKGEIRYLGLSPGIYQLEFVLSGFAKVVRSNITVSVGQNTNLDVPMKLAGVVATIEVTGESTLLDTRKTGSQTTVSQVELTSIPSARDPWVILNTAPGVQIDRVNVGGSESGQQSVYVGKGSGTTQGTWNVDGVNITDMGATGSSPTYFEFDAYAEMNFATGGADASIQTPGVQLNLVTKRGTNDVHGSARVYYEGKKTASDNVTQEMLDQQQRLGLAAGAGNSIDSLQDYGLELGGPVIKDKLWLWGSYGRNQIDLVVPGGVTDKTTLQGYSFKANLQPIPENSFDASYMNNEKLKFGRGAGANHPQETTWNQTGPTKIYKVEDSNMFGSDVFASVSYSRVMSEFQLTSIGRGQMYTDENGVFHNSYVDYGTWRPQTQFTVTPSFFLRTGSVGHELKAGFTYRKTPVASNSTWPTGIVAVAANSPWAGLSQDAAEFTRPSVISQDLMSYSGYLSDTLTMNKLTAQIGVRYDYQKGTNLPFSVPLAPYDPAAWPGLPLTALNVPGNDPLIWKDISPRVGLTYAIGNANKTIARLSYARFANQMGGTNINPNSAAPGATYLYYAWNDANGNRRVDPGEVDFTNLLSYYNWDPNNPNNVSSSINKINYNMKTPKTDEFILGAEHELAPAFVVGVSGTYRRMTDVLFNERLSADGSRVLTPADFDCTQAGPYPVPGGSPQSIEVCNPKPGVAGLGYIETNRPGYYQTYWGLDFSATKRYANKWMMRFNFTYSDWTQHGLAEGVVDPSNLVGGSEAEGGIVAPQSTGSGSKSFVYINSKWQGTLSAMYTLPLDFNVATNMFARQGYAAPYYRQVASSNLPGVSSKKYQLGNADDVRMPTVFEWDLGLSKAVKAGPLTVTLQADCFNVLNRGTELQRNLRARSTATTTNVNDNYVYEIQSPRIWRLGARLAF